MPHLLLEVGCEELPAIFVRKAYTDLRDAIAAALGEAFGGSFSGRALGTPRRLIVAFDDVPARQEDAIKEVRGPALKAAFDEAGNPTGALQGFCRSNGAEVGQLRKDEQYVWFDKPVPGRPSDAVLAELLPKAIKGLSFDKSMRWGAARLRFARPIRWLLATLDGEAVPFEIEGVHSGVLSRGHRFYSPEEFEARSFDELVDGLRKRKVEADPEKREAMIREQAMSVANHPLPPGEGSKGFAPDLPDALVDENVFLAEWPTAIAGEFKEEHLDLPEPVLTTAMAKHERMFPVRDSTGKLTRRFVFVRNSGEDDTVRRGAEWVLNARLDDAQFFYREDLKRLKEGGLDYFLEKTSGIVFQEKLGTVRERADRLERLCRECAMSFRTWPPTGSRFDLNEEVNAAAQAGKYAKADLSTGLVSDMASLQGIVGGEYSRGLAWPAAVSYAISNQYDHGKCLKAIDSKDRVATFLIVADNVDKLAGLLGLGLVPTGSSDPFGLRRSVQVLIDVALSWPDRSVWEFSRLIERAVAGYGSTASLFGLVDAKDALDEMFRARYKEQFANVRYDIRDAATWDYVTAPQIIRNRIGILEILANDTSFVRAATRPINLVEAEKRKGWEPRSSTMAQSGNLFFDSAKPFVEASKAAGAKELAQTLDDLVVQMGSGMQPNGVAGALVGLSLRLQSFIERSADLNAQSVSAVGISSSGFIDGTMVNVDDEDVRDARLNLLDHAATRLKMFAGDFSKIVIDG